MKIRGTTDMATQYGNPYLPIFYKNVWHEANVAPCLEWQTKDGSRRARGWWIIERLALSALDELCMLHLTHWRWANLDDFFGKNIYDIRSNWKSFHRNSLSSCFLQNKMQGKEPRKNTSPVGTTAARSMGTALHTPAPPQVRRRFWISHYFVFPLQCDFQIDVWPA